MHFFVEKKESLLHFRNFSFSSKAIKKLSKILYEEIFTIFFLFERFGKGNKNFENVLNEGIL